MFLQSILNALEDWHKRGAADDSDVFTSESFFSTQTFGRDDHLDPQEIRVCFCFCVSRSVSTHDNDLTDTYYVKISRYFDIMWFWEFFFERDSEIIFRECPKDLNTFLQDTYKQKEITCLARIKETNRVVQLWKKKIRNRTVWHQVTKVKILRIKMFFQEK